MFRVLVKQTKRTKARSCQTAYEDGLTDFRAVLVGGTKFRAAVLVALFTLLTTPAIAQEPSATVNTEVQITEKARQLFQAGVDFMQDPDGARYAEAYRSFKAAYAESPSWKILGNLGISAMKIERDGEAIEALETYLREGRDHLDQEEIDQVERDLRTLRTSVTYVTLSITEPGTIVEDVRTPLSGQTVNNRYEASETELRIGIHNGRHRMTVTKEGFDPATWSFEASGGDLSHHFELAEIPDEPETTNTIFAPAVEEQPARRPVPTATWVALGTTAAFGIGATVTGILALGAQNDFDESGNTDASARKRGMALNITTDALLGATLISATVATITYFTRPQVDARRDTAWHVAPSAWRDGGGLFIHGLF